MRRRAKPGVLLVATREWRWIMRDRLAPILIFGVPLIAFIALTAIFSSQVIRGLGVVVVDDDRSQTSSIFIEALAASANLKIVERATNHRPRRARSVRAKCWQRSTYRPVSSAT